MRACNVWAHGVSHYVGVSVRERAVYGLIECPNMWGVSVRGRAVYGLMECPNM